jgi:hypothetical protein
MPEKKISKETIRAEWRATEFKSRPKSLDWFIGFGLISAALLVWALYTLNFLFALLVFSATAALLIISLRKPRIYTFKLTDDTLWVGDQQFSFENFDSYWIFKTNEGTILSLKPKSRFGTPLHIPLPKEVEEIKSILQNSLEEVEDHYSLADWLADRLRI